MRPYISIDLETTGLDRARAEILEIGAVLDTGHTAIENLNTYHAIIKRPHIAYAEPYALKMNAGLIDKIAKGEGVDIQTALAGLVEFIQTGVSVAESWDVEFKRPQSSRGTQIALGGKNVAAFDVPILRRELESTPFLDLFNKSIYYAFVDPGSMYMPEFGRIPQLYEIKRLLDIGDNVSHRALDDAFDVVRVVRHKMNIPF